MHKDAACVHICVGREWRGVREDSGYMYACNICMHMYGMIGSEPLAASVLKSRKSIMHVKGLPASIAL